MQLIQAGRATASATGFGVTSGWLMAALLATGLAACATVKVQAPDKPIEINLNVKIQQEVRVTLDKAAADLISKNPNLF